MKRFGWYGFFTAIALTVTLLVGIPAASAAGKWIKADEIKLEADKSVTPMDYSFALKSTTGKLEFGELKNLYGAGAGFIVYVNLGQEGRKWLLFKFDSGSVTAGIVGQPSGIFSFKQSAVTATNPLIVEILNDILTIKVGAQSRSLTGATAFSGGITTQSIETTVKVYQWQDE